MISNKSKELPLQREDNEDHKEYNVFTEFYLVHKST